MSTSPFSDLKSYVGFTSRDATRLAALAGDLQPVIPRIVEGFYEVILQHPAARAVFRGGQDQMATQRFRMAAWLVDLFHGKYGDNYFNSRQRIGATHVSVGLPQQYMPLGMHILRRLIHHEVQALALDDQAFALAAIDKLLTLDLTIMLLSYQRHQTEIVRSDERAAAEEKITQTQHMAEIGQLAAALAHEIKNPLAGISGAIQIIGESLQHDDPHRPIIREVLGQIKRLDAAVKDLLLYARPAKPRLQMVRLTELVPRILLVLHEEPTMQRVNATHNCNSVEVVLYADEAQIEQLLMNLILNAAQASPRNGTVHVEVERDDGMVAIRVRDNGSGMSPEAASRALEPFYTTKARGTGLGLPICQRIVVANSGTMTISSEQGRGTEVCVALPRYADS